MPSTAERAARSPRQRLHKRRAEVIEAAARVFAERGYHAASTQDIADVLNMRQASLYYYFRSREQALYEVCLIGVQGFLEGLEAIRAGDAPVADKIRAAVRNHMMPLRERGAYVRVFLRDRRFVPGTERATIRRVERRYELLWQKLIAEGQANGQLAGGLDPRVTAFAIIGMCNAATAWLDPHAPGELEQVADQFADLVLRGLMARAD